MVVPLDQDHKDEMVKVNRAVVKDCLKGRIIASRRNNFAGLLGIEKDKMLDDHVREHHSIRRDGKLFCKFSATVLTFPHHDEYST